MQTMLVAPRKESCRNAALFFVPPAPFRPTTLNDLIMVWQINVLSRASNLLG